MRQHESWLQSPLCWLQIRHFVTNYDILWPIYDISWLSSTLCYKDDIFWQFTTICDNQWPWTLKIPIKFPLKCSGTRCWATLEEYTQARRASEASELSLETAKIPQSWPFKFQKKQSIIRKNFYCPKLICSIGGTRRNFFSKKFLCEKCENSKHFFFIFEIKNFKTW